MDTDKCNEMWLLSLRCSESGQGVPQHSWRHAENGIISFLPSIVYYVADTLLNANRNDLTESSNNSWGGNHYYLYFTNKLRPQKKLSLAQGYTANKGQSWDSKWGKRDLKRVELEAFKIWRVKEDLILLVWKAVFRDLSLLSPSKRDCSQEQ